ncbi:MAG: hypothetical protein HUJ61_06970 [Bacilli bacterium]|nr:hypothetical protein [Bacilli bacterium]
MNKELIEKLLDFANNKIDEYCEFEGVDTTIALLVECFDLTKQDLIELNFDIVDINNYFGVE